VAEYVTEYMTEFVTELVTESVTESVTELVTNFLVTISVTNSVQIVSVTDSDQKNRSLFSNFLVVYEMLSKLRCVSLFLLMMASESVANVSNKYHSFPKDVCNIIQ